MNDTIAHLDIAPAAKTPFQITMAQFRRHKLAVVSLILLVIFVVLSLLMMASGEDLVTAFAAVASSIANLGPALGKAAATMQPLDDWGTWICTIAMLLGRLEVFTVLVLLTPAFWRE